MTQMNERNTTMAICRQVVLTEFMDDFLTEIKKQAGAELNPEEVKQCLN